MNKRENAKILLKAMSDVEDTYVSEALNAPVKKQEKQTNPFSFMNNMRFAAAAFACLLIAFISINVLHINNPDTNNNVQVVNPVQEVETMDEAESITGFTLEYQNDANEDEIITVYDGNMIEVTCSEYYIRKAEGDEDISGDYTEYDAAEEETISSLKVTVKGDGEKWSVATWENDGYTYAIGCQSQPMTLEQLRDLIVTVR